MINQPINHVGKQTKISSKHRDLETVVSMYFYLEEVAQRNILNKKERKKEESKKKERKKRTRKRKTGGRERGRETSKGYEDQGVWCGLILGLQLY